jgi:hypothetical protein
MKVEMENKVIDSMQVEMAKIEEAKIETQKKWLDNQRLLRLQQLHKRKV